jgi:anti-sigma28 factor (negative regulator of flagellin synthesis)
MDIPRDLRPADNAVRRRPADNAGGIKSRTPTPPEGTPAKPAPGVDQAAVTTDPAKIARYVDVLKTMNPANLHRVEDLRARIADGSYSAEPEELADLIIGERPDHGPRNPLPRR